MAGSDRSRPADAESNSLLAINVLRLMNFRSLILRVLFAGLLAVALLTATGCPDKTATPAANGRTPAKGSQPLVLLVVDDPHLGEAVAREWRGRTEQELTVHNATAARNRLRQAAAGRCVIFPSGLIGQLAERGLIVPLTTQSLDNADFNYRDIFDQLRLREMKWGDKTLAASLGSPQLLLAYRADILEKLQLSPPATWAEYQKAVAKLSDRAALGESSAAGRSALARHASSRWPKAGPGNCCSLAPRLTPCIATRYRRCSASIRSRR